MLACDIQLRIIYVPKLIFFSIWKKIHVFLLSQWWLANYCQFLTDHIDPITLFRLRNLSLIFVLKPFLTNNKSCLEPSWPMTTLQLSPIFWHRSDRQIVLFISKREALMCQYQSLTYHASWRSPPMFQQSRLHLRIHKGVIR